ncbi:hypothetical protein KA005_80165 [bacterium]|nr:hypothetical protein [bacterium]
MEHVNFKDLEGFSDFMKELSEAIGFRVSSRGWAYILEQKRFINKDQFDKATNAINKCRKKGLLPIDFTAEESARDFKGVEIPTEKNVIDDFGDWVKAAYDAADYYTPNWWEGEGFYIQMVVEKIDLVTLFEPVCKEYHIPIANSKGWSSMLQRAEYSRRFAEAEEKGLTCVLLYCGDHDPDGLRISEFIRKNLSDLKDVQWEDGTTGYDPENLIIDRFGLNYDFIQQNGFTWIDNLITGSGKNLASPSHKNFKMPYVQSYLKEIGERKCEANAIVVLPSIAQNLVRENIERYLGPRAKSRFKEKRDEIKEELEIFLNESGSGSLLDEVFNNIRNR